jgi:alpha-beta hydrolase superfamily lysophospholipase
MGSAITGAHPIDVAVAWLARRSKLFSRGWGDESLLADLSQQFSFADALPPIYVHWQSVGKRRGTELHDGTFASPLTILPAETGTAHVRACSAEGNTSACVILAASRDEGYVARKHIFGPLVRRGIDLYLLENPFYGRRRTAAGPSLATFCDQALMSLAMVWEARALLEFLRNRYEKLAVAGYSMGGHMAAIAAAVSPFPLACAALATGASAAPIYTQGLLSWSVDLDALAGKSDLRIAARERLQHLIEAADITRLAPPTRPDAAVIVGCTRDGYVLAAEIERLHAHWPGSTLRWIHAGHISALLRNRRALCDAIAEGVEKL